MDVTQVDHPVQPLHWLNFVKFLAFIRNPVENAPSQRQDTLKISELANMAPISTGLIWVVYGQLPKDTPPKTNMEPENRPLEKEIPIGNHHFQVPCWISGVYQKDSGRNYWELSSGIPFPRSFAESENTWKCRWWKKSKQPTWDLQNPVMGWTTNFNWCRIPSINSIRNLLIHFILHLDDAWNSENLCKWPRVLHDPISLWGSIHIRWSLWESLEIRAMLSPLSLFACFDVIIRRCEKWVSENSNQNGCFQK